MDMKINSVGILGAGLMGRGIAQVCALAGFNVHLVDVSQAQLQRGLESITTSLDKSVAKGALTAEARNDTVERIEASTSQESLERADLIIEAATENLELKLRLLSEVEKRASAHALIASNTSSISITQLGAVLSRPERFIGMHFFNPVPSMGLVELIPGLQTDDSVLQAAQGFVEALGKTGIVVRNSPGFVVNRILCPMLNEAIFVLGEGLASAEAIDAGMKLGCNHPVGPLALADMVGLDTLLSVLQIFYDGFNDPKYRPAPLLKELVAAGHLGRKAGRGFFSYS